jgi:Phytanoyl-CoA dioxygenase (PhyH)
LKEEHGMGIENWLRFGKELASFGKHYVSFLLFGSKTGDLTGARALRTLHCMTNGRVNDILAYFHRITHAPYQLDTRSSVIAGFDQDLLFRVVQQLDQEGYFLFSEQVPKTLCDELSDMAVNASCTVTREDGTVVEGQRYNPLDPPGVRCEIGQQDIMENAAAQKMVTDPGIIAIAQAYFRAKAVHDLTALWWSTPSKHAVSAAAQLYHFDMDRVKFLKFFVYLTDVNEENGPHCYVAGSHRGVPRSLRKDGRLTDEEVFAHYPPSKRISIIGPRGTLIAVDTRGLHKGNRLLQGHRLIFQLEFAINLFGMYYPPIILNEHFTSNFLTAMKEYPYTYRNYLFPEEMPRTLQEAGTASSHTR